MEILKKEYTQESTIACPTNDYPNRHLKRSKARKLFNSIFAENLASTIKAESIMYQKKVWKATTVLKQYITIKRNIRFKDKVLTRVHYVRYADNWIVGVTGKKETAIQIKEKISLYLKEILKFDLNENRINIAHLTIHGASFLGTEIKVTARNLRSEYVKRGKIFTRLSNNGRIKLYAPIKNLIKKLKNAGFAWKVKVTEKVRYVINKKNQK